MSYDLKMRLWRGDADGGELGDYTVAVDADAAVVEALYRELRADGVDTILPLVGNLADPSPGLGWRGEERRPLVARGRPDLTLALALVWLAVSWGLRPVARATGH